MLMNNELLKASSIRMWRDTNTIYTCYGELGIFIWNVFLITGLLIPTRCITSVSPAAACYEQEAPPLGFYSRDGRDY